MYIWAKGIIINTQVNCMSSNVACEFINRFEGLLPIKKDRISEVIQLCIKLEWTLVVKRGIKLGSDITDEGKIQLPAEWVLIFFFCWKLHEMKQNFGAVVALLRVQVYSTRGLRVAPLSVTPQLKYVHVRSSFAHFLLLSKKRR